MTDKKKDTLTDIEKAVAKATAKLEQVSDWQRRQLFGRKPTGPVRYASFNDRVFASVIDTALSLVLLGPMLLGLSNLAYGGSRQNVLAGLPANAMPSQVMMHLQQTNFFNQLLLDYSIHFVVFGIIVLWLWNRSSSTPGKWLLRMRIVDADTFCKPSPKQLILRYLGYIVSLTPLTLGFFWVLIDKKGRAWHDMIGGTVVVKVKHWRFKDDGVTPHIEATS